MSIKRFVPALLSVFIFIVMIVLSAQTSGKSTLVNKQIATADSATSSVDEANKKETSEMRGVWITYMELDMENEADKSEKAFIKKFTEIAENSSKFGFNTLIVQVRPFSDAMYNSKYFPYSHIITGEQGKNPGYDPLKIMCDIADNYKMKIHAWINPYRISTNKTPSELAENHPYVKDDSIGKETSDGIYYDPSNEKARKLIIDGVKEIVENYDVDGVQFDDYFYPTYKEEFDENEYIEYVEKIGEDNSMSLDNWRLANVNMLICETYRAIHSIDDNVDFGVSPQGNIDNNALIYADVRSWCNCRGFVDYICPQIYFSLENPDLTFENCLESWLELEYDKNVELYIGLAGYKAGSEADNNTWTDKNDILAQEYAICSKNEKVNGFMLYSYSSLENKEAQNEIANLKSALN